MDIFFYIGAFDAVMVAVVGVIGAVLVLLGIDTSKYADRVVPAAAILVGTSLAAGVIMLLTNWITG